MPFPFHSLVHGLMCIFFSSLKTNNTRPRCRRLSLWHGGHWSLGHQLCALRHHARQRAEPGGGAAQRAAAAHRRPRPALPVSALSRPRPPGDRRLSCGPKLVVQWWGLCRGTAGLPLAAQAQRIRLRGRSPGSRRFHPWAGKIPRGGHGSPFQGSGLEDPRDRGALSTESQKAGQD